MWHFWVILFGVALGYALYRLHRNYYLKKIEKDFLPRWTIARERYVGMLAYLELCPYIRRSQLRQCLIVSYCNQITDQLDDVCAQLLRLKRQSLKRARRLLNDLESNLDTLEREIRKADVYSWN